MNKKLFLMFAFATSCVFAADDQFYLADDFAFNLDVDDAPHETNDLYLMDLDIQDAPDFFNLNSPIDDVINDFCKDVQKKESIEKIIGKDVENHYEPREALIVNINAWTQMTPEDFIHDFNILKSIAQSDDYNHVPELKNACRHITKFIKRFIAMHPNSLQALCFIDDNAFAWQQWVNIVHMNL